ncbi:MAG: hypothetical protein EBR10_07005 [Planctomycetes bacterium]|nr:hypothetical protein [Planctomycetota bacterium]
MHAVHRWLQLGALVERELFASARRSERAQCVPTADALGSWCFRCGATLQRLNAPPPHWPPLACASCAGSSTPFTAVVRLGAHAEGWRDAVLAVKHGRDRRCGEQLGLRLAQQWTVAWDSLPSWRSACSGDWCAVPVPMPFARRVERGIDHAHVIAKAFARSTSMQLMRVLWQQCGTNQARLDRAARVARRGRMQWRTRTPFLRASVDMNAARGVQQWVIVDDVTTTGATLREVAEVLRAVTPRARIAAAVVAVA